MARDPHQELEHYRERLAEARQESANARRARVEAEARAAAAEASEKGLTAIVSGLETLVRAQQPIVDQARLPTHVTGGGTVSTNGHAEVQPRGKEAVKTILSETGREWRAGELTEEIQRREWIKRDARNPEAAVRQALKRLFDEGVVVQTEVGLYKLSSEAGESNNRVPDASE